MATKQTQKTLPTQITTPTRKTKSTQKTLPTQITLPTSTGKTDRAQSFYADYNDPLELNSAADVILNDAAIKKASEKWGAFSWTEKIPILRNIAATIDLSWNYGIKPIINGDGAAAVLNSFINLGETLDVVANPIKGLLMEGPEGFQRGIGFGDQGRKNYDWNTGNLLADISLEIVSDPTNWLTFGGKSLLKAGVTSVTKTVTGESVQNILTSTVSKMARIFNKNISDEALSALSNKLTKVFNTQLTNTITDYTTGTIRKIAKKRLTKKGVKITAETLQEAISEVLEQNIDNIAKLVTEDIAKTFTIEDLANIVIEISEDTPFTLDQLYALFLSDCMSDTKQLLKTLQWDNFTAKRIQIPLKIYTYTQKFEEALFKSAFYTSGLGLGSKAIYHIGSNIKTFFSNMFMRNFRAAGVMDANNVFDIFKSDLTESVRRDTANQIELLHGGKVDYTKSASINAQKLQLNNDIYNLQNIASKSRKNPADTIRAFNLFINGKYPGHNLQEYFQQLKSMNEQFNGVFTSEILQIERILRDIEDTALLTITNKPVPTKLRTITHSAGIRQTERVDNIIKAVEKAETDTRKKHYKGIPALTQGLTTNTNKQIGLELGVMDSKTHFYTGASYYVIKYNELRILKDLLNNEKIMNFVREIAFSKEGTIGMILHNILDDPLSKNSTAHIIASKLKASCTNLLALEQFIYRIESTPYEVPKGISLIDFQGTLADILYSFNNLTISDALLNTEGIALSILNKTQQIINARLRTGADPTKQIRIPDSTTRVFTKQFKDFINALDNNTSSTAIFYPIANFSNDIKQLQDLGYLLDDRPDLLVEVLTGLKEVYEPAKIFEQNMPLIDSNFIFRNPYLSQKYNLGNTDITSALYQDELGEQLFSLKKYNSMHFDHLFDARPGDYLDIGMFKEMSDFAQGWYNKVSYINDELFTLAFNSADKLNYITEYLVQLLEEFKVFEGTKPRVLEKVSLKKLTPREQLGLLQYLYNISFKEQHPTDFLRQFFGKTLNDLKHNAINIAPYIRGTKPLSIQTLHNPQLIKTTARGLEHSPLYPAIRMYESFAGTIAHADSNNIFYIAKRTEDLAKASKAPHELHFRQGLVKVSSKAQKVFEDLRKTYNVAFNSEVALEFLKSVDSFTAAWKRTVSADIAEDFSELLSRYRSLSYVQDVNIAEALTEDEFTRLVNYIQQIKEFADQEALEIQQTITQTHLEISDAYKQKKANYEEMHQLYEANTESYLALKDIWNNPEYIASKKKIKALQNVRDSKKALRNTLKQTSEEKAEIERLVSQFKHNKKILMEEHKKILSEVPSIRNYKQEVWQSITSLRTSIKEHKKDLRFLRQIPNPTEEDKITLKIVQNQIKELESTLEKYSNLYKALTEAIDSAKISATNFKELIYQFNQISIEELNQYTKSINKAQRVETVRILNKQIFNLNEKIKDTFEKRLITLPDGTKMTKEEYLSEEIRAKYGDYKENKDAIELLKQLNEEADEDINRLKIALYGREETPGLYSELKDINNAIKNMDITMAYHDAVSIQDALRKPIDYNTQNDILRFLNLPVQDMFEELAHSGGLKILNFNNYKNIQHIQGSYNSLKYKKDELEKLGVHIVDESDKTGFVYLVIDKTVCDINYDNGVTIINGTPVYRKRFKNYNPINIARALQPDVTEATYKHLVELEQTANDFIKELNIAKSKYKSDAVFFTGMGELLTEDVWDSIYEGVPGTVKEDLTKSKKDFTDIEYYAGLPEEVRKYIYTKEELTSRGFFKHLHYNEILLTDYQTTRTILPYASNSYLNTLRNITQELVVHGNAKMEALDTLADSQFSINEGIFKNFSDEDLHKYLANHPTSRVITIVENEKYLIKIKEIPILNIGSIKEARRLNGIVVHESVYKQLVSMFNYRLGNEGFLHYYNRLMYIYKMGYLLNPGTILRNAIDTFLKTALDLGKDTFKYLSQAVKILHEYNEITKAVLDNYGTYSLKYLKEYLDTCGKQYQINYDMYLMLEEFFQKGPIDNISQELKGEPLPKDTAWAKLTETTSTIMDKTNGPIETIARLAMFLKGIAEGEFKEDIWKRIADTHFDYSFKSDAEQIIEMIFPFMTFGIRNMIYWIEKLQTMPELIGLLRDIYTPIWNFDELSPEQLEYSRALQTQIMNGNISLFESDSKEYILRVNPSIFDVYNTAINPIEAIINKLAAPIDIILKTATGQLENPLLELPLIGTAAQRINKAVKEQNILPSVLTIRNKTKPTIGSWSNPNLRNSMLQNTANPYYVLPKLRTDVGVDPYKTIGVKAYTSRMMGAPKVNVKVNVYDKLRYQSKTEVYNGIRYQLKLDINKFR